MTAPATGRERPIERRLGGSYPRRGPKGLAASRFGRALQRQWPIFLVVASLMSAGGIAYDLTGGLAALASAKFWAPVAIVSALVICAAREIGRNTVTSLASFGKHRGYAILGASPELTERALRQLPPDQRTPIGCLASLPASPFATAFRDLQSNIQDDGVVAFVGSSPNEGASTVALCTAVSACQQGRNVLVIDCDVRRRSLTRTLGFDPDEGIVEACASPEDWREFVGEEDEVGLHFIPASRFSTGWAPESGPGLSRLLEALRDHYELIVLDSPPVLASTDARLITSMADKIVMVTAWDRTPLPLVRRAMSLLQNRPPPVAGVYVNRVPPQYRFGRLRGD